MTTQSFEAIPGPAPRFLVGELPTFRALTPWGACAQYGATFGGMTRIRVLGRSAVVLNDPALIGEVLTNAADAFYKDRPVQALLPIGTDASVFTSPGGAHWEVRRKASPFSHAAFGAWLARQGPALGRQVLAGLQRLKPGVDDGWEALLRVSFDAVSVALVGRTLGDDVFRDFLVLEAVGTKRLGWPLPVFPPLSSRFKQAQARWFATFDALVAEAKAGRAAGSLVEFMLKEAPPTSDRAGALELANSYFGGCFSVSTSILNTLYFVTTTPTVREALEAELEALNLPADGAVDLMQLHRHVPLARAIREALRVFPPVPVFLRSVKKEADAVLGGHTIPAGTGLLMSPWAVHRSEKQWPEPLTYRPERWDEATLKATPYGSDRFFPFGRGPRSCIGEALAMALVETTVANALVHCSLKAGEGQELSQDLRFAVFAPKTVRVRF